MAIKANELRTSNILKLFLGVNDEGAQYREFAISGVMSNDGAEFYLLGHTWVEISDDLEPIPLTEEWLLKFGFEITYSSNFRIKFDHSCNYVGYDYSHNSDKSMEGFRFYGHYIKCEYVHQLQNLFHALTGEELTYTPSKI